MPVFVLLYCASFHYSYEFWISPVWGYEGFTYETPNPALLGTTYVLAGVLCALSPLKIRRPSQVIYWVLYFTVYIPGLLVPLFLQLDSDLTLLLLQLSMTAGMLAIALSYRLRLVTLQRHPANPRLFWTIFAAVFLVCNAAAIAVFRNNLHLASLQEIYSARYQARGVFEQNPAIGYISQLLANVLNPLLIARGLESRRKILTGIGILGELIVYSIAVSKASLLAPFVIIGLYYSLKTDLGGWVPKATLSLVGMLLGLTTLVIGAKPGVLFNIATIAIARTIAAPGMLIGQYQYFFETQPHTYLGHVTGFNLLVPNPYSLPIGMEMSAFYGVKTSNDRGMVNENANLFATDGIGGFGLVGIPIIAILCAAVFWVLDSCARDYTKKFCVSALAMQIVSLGNVSLFSTLLGNGLIAWILLFVVMPRSFLDSHVQTHNLPKIPPLDNELANS